MIHKKLNCLMQRFAIAVLLFYLATPCSADAEKGLKPYEKNPYFWQFGGQPTLLLGGSSEDNLFQLEEKDLIQELDRLKEAGGNYLRNTLSSRDAGNSWPFARLGGHYDLEQWNDVYWQRLEIFLRETFKRGIIVQLELWDPFDYHGNNWRNLNPFNPRLNSNYSVAGSGLPEEVIDHPSRWVQHPFFRTVLKEDNLDVVLSYQRRLMDRVLEHTLRYPHVLYCISNETTGTPAWGIYWADFIRERASRAKRNVNITEMWDNWDMKASQHRPTFDHPERYDFVDLSQNTHNSGQVHANGVLWVRSYLTHRPRPMNAVKIYGSDQRNNSGAEAVERFWRNIFCGMATSRFHRPPSGLGNSDQALHQITTARFLQENFNFFDARPASQLLDDRRQDEAYALISENVMAVYFPLPEPPTWWEKPLAWVGQLDVTERSVTLTSYVFPGKTRQIAWLTPTQPQALTWQSLPPGPTEVTPPSGGHWIALIREQP